MTDNKNVDLSVSDDYVSLTIQEDGKTLEFYYGYEFPWRNGTPEFDDEDDRYYQWGFYVKANGEVKYERGDDLKKGSKHGDVSMDFIENIGNLFYDIVSGKV